MNILTKICVVLLVVASLTASVVFISLATVAPNWYAEYKREEANSAILEAQRQMHEETASRLVKENNDLRLSSTKRENALASKISELTNENSNKEIKNTKLGNDINRISSQITALRGNLAAAVAANKEQDTKLHKAWLRENKLMGQIIELGSSLKKTQADLERRTKSLAVVKEQSQRLKELLVEANKTIAKLEKGGGTEEAATDGTPLPDHRVAGTITAIRNNLASINVGSAHGLKTGMKLIVYRGDQFVGRLKIEQVHVNEAAGVIVDKVLAPQQGDKVTSHLN
ncbi:MAG: hypothetical protein K8S55_15415 [Phycisphaerae bacterium]|nr:hypothetical protein [Phycisphaerae bacterium]